MKDGIVVLGEEPAREAYDDGFFSLLAEVEDRHPWFRARNRTIIAYLRGVLGELPGRRVLDIGCGTGFVLAALEATGMSSAGLDVSLTGLRIASRRVRGPLVCAHRGGLPFEPRSFDVVLLCDVLEHVAEPAELLAAAGRLLRPDGRVLVTVPADPRLWSAVDIASGHERRYTSATLAGTIRAADLRVDRLRYLHAALWPLQLARRLTSSHAIAATSTERARVVRAALRPPARPLAALFDVVARVESLLGDRLPFGTSLIALAQVPGGDDLSARAR